MSRKRRKKLFVHPKDWGSSSDGVTVQEGEHISKLLRSRNGLLTHIILIDGTVIKALDVGFGGRDCGDCFDRFSPNSTFEAQARALEPYFFYSSEVVEISNEDGTTLFRSAKQPKTKAVED